MIKPDGITGSYDQIAAETSEGGQLFLMKTPVY
jgi:hypothetical protein